MSKFDLNSFIGTPDVMKNAVQNIDINKLVPYKNHCFKLYEGERLDDMVRSVQLYGIMVPIIVRIIPQKAPKRKCFFCFGAYFCIGACNSPFVQIAT